MRVWPWRSLASAELDRPPVEPGWNRWRVRGPLSSEGEPSQGTVRLAGRPSEGDGRVSGAAASSDTGGGDTSTVAAGG